MLVERSELMVKEGMEDGFVAAMKERGIPLLNEVPGTGAATMGRGVENPDKFLLLLEWDSMEAHDAFKTHRNYAPFREVLGPFLKGGSMEHFNMY